MRLGGGVARDREAVVVEARLEEVKPSDAQENFH